MTGELDMTASAEARSDQINAADLISGPRTYTIEKVTEGKATHPFDFHLVESPGKVYRPNTGMRRVIIAGWGPKTEVYHGRRLTLLNEPTVIYAGAEIGGLRVSHMSHLDKPLKTSLAINQKKKVPYIVEPLTEAAPPAEPSPEDRASKAVAWFSAKGVERQHLEAHVGLPIAEWTAAHLSDLTESRESIVSESTGDQS